MNKYFKSLNSFQLHLNEIPQTSNISIFTINIRSISSISKFNKFKTLIANFPQLPAIICIQETWFQEDCLDLYKIPGYKNVNCCRNDGYGGTSIYVKENIEYSVDLCESENFIEAVVITLCNHTFSGKPLKIMSFYRSQKCIAARFYNYMEHVLDLFSSFPCIFVGDSNIDFLETSVSHELNAIIESYDFKNCHTFITRPDSGTSIDIVFSNMHNRLKTDAIECKLSDHNIIFCRLESRIQVCDVKEIMQSHCNYDLIKQHIRQNLQLSELSGNPTSDTKDIIGCLSNAISCATTKKKKKCLLNFEVAPWINANLQSLIKLKNSLLKTRRKKPSADLNMRLKRLSKVIKIATKEAMNNYYSDKLSKVQHDPRKCWKFLNQTLGRSRAYEISLKNNFGQFIKEDKDKAEILNQYFINSVYDLRRSFEYTAGESWNTYRSIRRHRNFFRLQQTNAVEVNNLIKNLEVNKAAGFDNISPQLLLECSNELVPYLVHIFNSSINKAIFPDTLKVQKIIPIPKESHSITVANYRPISLLSTIDKIFEKILYNQLATFLDGENLLANNQYGFRKGCGTDEAVVNLVNYICECLDCGFSGVGGMFYDFTKAFDLVDHTILIEKLSFYGLSGRELAFFKSYVSNRKQFVEINSATSSIEDVKCGVPQGSVLGPLLFKIYLNDINNFGLRGKVLIYADDLCVLYPYHQDILLKSDVDHDTALIAEYAKLNKLILNPSKTKFIRFKPQKNRSPNCTIELNGEKIPEATTVKYLGVIIQNNLSWQSHIQQLKSKLSPITGILFKVRNKLNERTKMMIFESLIQSKLSYLALIYGNKKNADLKSLQVIQNKALKNIFKLPMMHSTLSLYSDVAKTVLPIYGIHKFQLLIYVYKVLHNIGHHTIKFYQNQQHFNTRHKQRIEYKGSLEYNKLPGFIKNAVTLSSFKTNLKRYLLQNIETLLI